MICILQDGGSFLVSILSQNLLGVKQHLLHQLWTMALRPGASPLGEWQDGETVTMSLLDCMGAPMDPQHLHLASQVSFKIRSYRLSNCKHCLYQSNRTHLWVVST